MGPTRLFLLDDHEIVRRGLRDLFQGAADVEVVGECDSAVRAVPMLRDLQPDVVLLDARLLDGDGIEVCRAVRSSHPQVRALILTRSPRRPAVGQATGSLDFSIPTTGSSLTVPDSPATALNPPLSCRGVLVLCLTADAHTSRDRRRSGSPARSVGG